MLQKCSVVLLIFLHLRITLGLSQPECFNVNTTTHRMIDQQGRERYFHGMNVVVKGPPWLPRTDAFHPTWSFVEKDMATLQELGLNAIRFGMMWPGAEPQRGQYNETYFNIVKDIVKKAATYNIHVLLDMHQDVLSAKFCGEGAPDWAIETGNAGQFPEPWSDPYIIDPNTGYPSKEDCAKSGWPLYYSSEATSSAFQHIYNNTNGLLDQLAAYWEKIANEFKDSSNILGYEIINEPWAGDIYHDPLLLWPQEADRKNLAHVYDVVSAAIWKNDPCHNVFFEPVTWDEWTVGFHTVPSGSGNEHRSVLSYHFYSPPDIDPDISFGYRMVDLERLKCGGFLTEFSTTEISSQMIAVMNYADKYFQSWTGWDYKPYYDITGDSSSLWFSNGTMNTELAAALSRTYVQAVAGLTHKMTYDHESQSFQLVYSPTSSCTSTTTEIYLNEAMHYPNGYTVSIIPATVSWNSPAKNYVSVVHDTTNIPYGTMIEVTIRPK